MNDNSSSRPKLRIAHVITRMIVGGAQENTLFTVTGQLEAGHHVVLITGESPGREGELLKNADYPDFEIIKIPSLQRELNWKKDLDAFRQLQKIFVRGRYDVVHTHSSKAGILGRIAAWKAGVPLVVHTVHGQAFHPYEKPLKNLVYKFAEFIAARHCHKIFSVAQAMIDQCVKSRIAPRGKYQVVYSGMDMDKFLSATREAQLRHELGIPENAQVIGAVARLFELKGYEFFLPAAFELAARHPDLHFLIVGDGALKESIEKSVNERGWAARFHFAGLVAPDQVRRFIAQMDILMHLSLREGLPRSVVQALACGVPAIGFKLDGTPEVIISGETGYCVEPENLSEVVKAAESLLADPESARKMGEAGRALVRDKFDRRYMVRELEEAYRRLLAGKHLSGDPPRLLLAVPRLNMGGAESCVYDLARKLKERGFDLHVVSGGGALAGKLKSLGIPHHWYSMRSRFYCPGFYIRHLVKKYRFDLVHAHSNTAILAVYRALKDQSVPFLATCHGAFSVREYSAGLYAARKLICVSHAQREFELKCIPALDPGKLEVILNGVDLDRFTPRLRNRNAASVPFKVGIISRLRVFGPDTGKGHYYLLDAMTREPIGERDWELHIAGKGRAAGKIKSFIRNHGLSSRVFFDGASADVPRLLGSLDAVALGSTFETFGLVLAEAAAMGIPQLSFNRGGTREVIADGETGYLFDYGSGDAMVAALEKLKNDRELAERMGQAARKRAEKLFDLDIMVDKTVECYKQVIEELPE